MNSMIEIEDIEPNLSGIWDEAVKSGNTGFNLSGIWDEAVKSGNTGFNLSGIWDEAVKSGNTGFNLSGIWDEAVKSGNTGFNLSGIDLSDVNKDAPYVISSINVEDIIKPTNYFKGVKPSLEDTVNQKLIEQVDKLENDLYSQNKKIRNQKKQSKIQRNKIDELEKKLGKMYPFADSGKSWVVTY